MPAHGSGRQLAVHRFKGCVRTVLGDGHQNFQNLQAQTPVVVLRAAAARSMASSRHLAICARAFTADMQELRQYAVFHIVLAFPPLLIGLKKVRVTLQGAPFHAQREGYGCC